ncbi:unnamed protein product [Triticum turgidum subsp. durum]|uniref:Uncharacterized protein n=1 Tax=Triticum turgidum subsp. durum TaxID=4567 RepID=A0A9R1AQ47_TRITD|nr:unnamed protein product [Triticum turgidum subsp. durum]
MEYVFFGGPILSTTGINAERNEVGKRVRPEGRRDSNSHQRDIRGEKAGHAPSCSSLGITRRNFFVGK